MSDNSKRLVADGYDLVAARYGDLEGRCASWPRMRWLRDALGRLPDGSRVLDLGCGAGIPAAAEIARRHSVTGVDISEAQIALAKENVPSGHFICADIAEMDFPPESFDAVVSFYAIDHVPREEHPGLLARIHRWLRPGGLFLLSTEDADEPGVVSEWLGVEMFFSGFDSATTRALVEAAGFLLEKTAVEVQLEAGKEIPYSWILAGRRS